MHECYWARFLSAGAMAAMTQIMTSALQGAGDTKFPMYAWFSQEEAMKEVIT